MTGYRKRGLAKIGYPVAAPIVTGWQTLKTDTINAGLCVICPKLGLIRNGARQRESMQNTKASIRLCRVSYVALYEYCTDTDALIQAKIGKYSETIATTDHRNKKIIETCIECVF